MNSTYLTGKGSVCDFCEFNRQNRQGSACEFYVLTDTTGRAVPVNSTYLTGKTGKGSACDFWVFNRQNRQGSACDFYVLTGTTGRPVPVSSTYLTGKGSAVPAISGI